MFVHEHHRRILRVLNALRADFFRAVGASFGGGTLLAMRYGEYRWSKDIDFLYHQMSILNFQANII